MYGGAYYANLRFSYRTYHVCIHHGLRLKTCDEKLIRMMKGDKHDIDDETDAKDDKDDKKDDKDDKKDEKHDKKDDKGDKKMRKMKKRWDGLGDVWWGGWGGGVRARRQRRGQMQLRACWG